MLSFHFSRFCLSQSQGSRREREFCSLNLEFRDENEIFLSISQGSRRERDFFYQYLRVRDENEIFLSISQDSRRERDFLSISQGSRRERDFFSSISQGVRRDWDIFLQVSCFQMGLRDEINLILTRIFEIEKSCHALSTIDYFPWLTIIGSNASPKQCIVEA